MSDEPIKISIVVPIYKVEDYVKTCIESIMGQSYRNLEIILVVKGSMDRCPEICDDYAKKDPRIRIIHQQNDGLVNARKIGTAAATGDYVLNVDGDDWIEKDRVEVLVRNGILPTNADMIHLSGYIKDFEEEGKESIRLSFDVSNKLFEDSEIENKVFPLMMREDEAFHSTINWGIWTWAIQRELLLKNQMLLDDRNILLEDFLCTCPCLLDARSVMTLQQGGYHYIQRAGSGMHQMVTSSDNDISYVKIMYRTLKEVLEQKRASEKIRKICSHVMVSAIMIYDYAFLLEKYPDYLFPFPKVRSGMKIVIYGAGNIGYRLVQYLSETKQCSVALWVDQNQNLSTVPGYIISPRDAIFSVDYDYIVVAIMNSDIAKDVKCALVQDGIPEGKIATMDASVISEDAIPDEIKEGWPIGTVS